MNERKIHDVAIDDLRTYAQPRKEFDAKALSALAQSIREVGILEPILARRIGAELFIVVGERRWRAARIAGLATVPVIVTVTALGEPDVTQRQLIADCQRENLTPIEKADAIRRLMEDAKWSATDASEKLGLSMATISRSLALLTLPEPIQAGLRSGTITASAAYELARIEDPAKQAALAEQVAQGRATRDAIAGARKAVPQTLVPSSRSTAKSNRLTAMLDADRSITVAGGGMTTVETLIQWLEELLAKARKVRPQGLELRTFLKILKDQAKA